MRFRNAAVALLKIGLFVVVFVLFEHALSFVLLSVSRSNGLLFDTLSTLLAALFAGWLMLRALEHRPARDLGFALEPGPAAKLFTGTALGAVGLIIAILAVLLAGRLRYTSDDGSVGQWLGGLLNMLLVFLVPAAAEEALFRGYAFQKLVDGFGAVLATILASAGFAFAHMQNPAVNAFALINIFAAGVMLSIAFLRTRNLWFVTGVHLGWNWSMAALLDLPVSGLELYDSPLYEPVDRGPPWLSGGAFGPEAGVAGLVGLTLVLAGVLWVTRRQNKQPEESI